MCRTVVVVLLFTVVVTAIQPSDLGNQSLVVSNANNILSAATVSNLTSAIVDRLNNGTNSSCGPYQFSYVFVDFLDAEWPAERFARTLINQWRLGWQVNSSLTPCYSGILAVVAAQNRTWYVTFGTAVYLSNDDLQYLFNTAKSDLRALNYDRASMTIVNGLLDLLLNPKSSSSSSLSRGAIVGIVLGSFASISIAALCCLCWKDSCNKQQQPPRPRVRKNEPLSPKDALLPIDECVICLAALDKRENNMRVLACGHPFHIECLAAWARQMNGNTCPVCRGPVIAPAAEPPIAHWSDQAVIDYRRQRHAIIGTNDDFLYAYFVIAYSNSHYAHQHCYQSSGGGGYETNSGSYDSGGGSSSFDTGGSFDGGGGGGGDW